MDESSIPSASEEQHLNTQDREWWKAMWTKQGQPWRTEPEIDVKRQIELAACRSITPEVLQSVYPFKGIKLGRADIEWLLATHEHGEGPVDYYDCNQQNRVGLDLRGADLSYAQLQNLPLARTVGDVTWRIWKTLTEKQHRIAAIQLQHADLKGAHLQGSGLEYANLESADLRGCHLEEVNLGTANLQGVYCEETHLEGADLRFAHLKGAFLWRTYLQKATLSEAHLAGAHLDHLILGDENHIGPQLVDTHWENANLAVVNWSQMYMSGEEYEARRKEREGKEKDRATRLKEFEDAVRVNRQLAVVLQSQGLNEDAARFAYRSQVLQRKVLALQGGKKLGAYLFSLVLALLTGYGYRMWRIIVVYILLVFLFAALYYGFGLSHSPHMGWIEAFVLSITAFHGRVFSSPFLPGSSQSVVTACEAIVGFTVEGIFIAMLTQRFFNR